MKTQKAYNYGGGSADIFFSLREKRFFNTLFDADRAALHAAYGGKQYYWSCSGASGAGFFKPDSLHDDLIQLPIYRDRITHLSEAWLGEVNGVKLMVPTSINSPFRENAGPMVFVINETICFVESTKQMLAFLGGEVPSEERVREWKFKFLFGEISISWWHEDSQYEKVSEIKLPYGFWEFINRLLPEKIAYARNLCEGDVAPDYNPDEYFHIAKCLRLDGLGSPTSLRYGQFGLPIERIDDLQARFVEGEYFSWPTGWVSTKNFIYKRKGDSIYAVYECKANELSSRFGENFVEYEREFNIFEFYSKSIKEWVSEMRTSVFEKTKDEFINSLRWSTERQKTKVRELLESNLETMFIVADSLSSGNCVPGTEAFMNQFGIKEPISAQDLLKHKSFDAMVGNSRFRAVVIKKLVLTEKEDPELKEAEEIQLDDQN